MEDSGTSKLSADLMISKRFRYTPILKNSFYNKTQTQERKRCPCCHSKPCRVCGYVVLVLLCALSLTGTGFLWGTDVFQDNVVKGMLIKNNSEAFDFWRKPPVKPTVKMYIFNYTNVNEFLSGRVDRPRVEQIGPYYYRETAEKVNVVFYPNGSLSYQEKHTYEFAPELSVGPETDRVVVPNLPLISAVSHTRDQYFLVRLGLSTMLTTLHAEPFVKVTVGELMWGYNDPVYTMGRTVLSLKENVPFQRFGLFMTRKGTSKYRVTMDTGLHDMDQLGVITHIDGVEHLDFWGSDECNRIDGSEGALYPPRTVRPNSTLHVYNRDMCRRFPLVFKEHSEVFMGIPTLRFHPPRGVFDHPDENPSNACYCHGDGASCPPSGVFNASPCAFNSPVMVSFPHFYLGDPVLLNVVDGLKPDPERHDSFIDVHQKLGVSLGGWSRLQLNIMVRKAKGVKQLDAFEDGAILPIAWIEVGLEDLPKDIQMMFYHATFSMRAMQLLFLYGLPVLALITSCLLYQYTCRKIRSCKPKTMIPLATPNTMVP